jgi:hypothetical protein
MPSGTWQGRGHPATQRRGPAGLLRRRGMAAGTGRGPGPHHRNHRRSHGCWRSLKFPERCSDDDQTCSP